MSTSQPSVLEPWADPSNEPLIRFENVTKRFGEFIAINNLSLDIYECEFFALLGASGCGKTTLLRLLAGFESPTEGRILVGGKDISNIPPNQRPINMMFQSYALFPHMSVEKNIGFGLKQEGKSKEAIKQRVDEMLALVKLESFAKRKPHQLSGGQKQRVALARSLAKSPQLLLLDEPLGALDKKLREQTQFELMNLQEALGLTFVIVTHDQEEAMTVASRIAVMDLGQLVQVDTPVDIYEQPRSRYVAEFIGDVNIIEGRIISNDTMPDASFLRYQLELACGTRIVVDESFSDMAENERLERSVGDVLVLAIRPEKLTINTAQIDAQESQIGSRILNHLQGEVWDIAYSGNISTYHVKMPSGLITKVQVTNQRRLKNRSITWEDNVWLSWSSTAAVIVE